MIVLSDIPTYLLVKTFKDKGIIVSDTINFPNELNKLEYELEDFLIVLGDIFHREILSLLDSEKVNQINLEIIEIIKTTTEELTNKNNKVYIPLIPTHFLISEKESYLNFKKETSDLLIHNLNNELLNYFSNNPNVFILNGLGHIKSTYSKDYFRYSSYLNKACSEELLTQYIKSKNKMLLNKNKLIICDLDNTLWKGILGDDLKSGIKMDPSDPIGKIFYSVQKLLLGLKNKGFLLAICSKNEKDSALDALFYSTSSVFKKEDIVTYRINWNSKSDNVKCICNELGLSFKETIFLDDNEYECDEVKRNCGGISIFKVPKDIYQFPYLIKSSSLFEVNNVTEEDKNRTRLYQEKSKRKKLLNKFSNSKSSRENWLKSLDTNLIINQIKDDSKYLQRIIQLFNRTNQFNLQSSKYNNNSFIQKINLKDFKYYYGIVSDRIGSEGLISVVGYREDQNYIYVNDYILSCRVFNRYIEELMLLPLLKLANKKDLGIKFEIKKSDRNIVSTKFVKKISNNTESIKKDLISNLLNRYMNLPVSIKISHNIIC